MVPEYDDEDDDEALVASAYSGAHARDGANGSYAASAAVRASSADMPFLTLEMKPLQWVSAHFSHWNFVVQILTSSC